MRGAGATLTHHNLLQMSLRNYADIDEVGPEDCLLHVAPLSHATGLYDDLTARENLDFAATMLDTPDRSVRVARALDDVGLSGRADARVRPVGRAAACSRR